MYQSNHVRTPSLITYKVGDVTGDGLLDFVYVTAEKTLDNPYLQQITLCIQDGRTGLVHCTLLPENSGYDPSLFLGDFTGNHVDDIFISVATGGSGAIYHHYLYSGLPNTPVPLIFDSAEYNEQFHYHVTFEDQYKVKLVSEYNGLVYIIDISMRDEQYLDAIYDQQGNLRKPITGFVNPLSSMYPVDFDSNGIYELMGYQKIAGQYNADSLGYVINTLGWHVNRFILENQQVAIYGMMV